MATLVGALEENTDTNTPVNARPQDAGLVEWVMERVNRWRSDRDNAYEKLWGEYWRMWRGRHTAEDKTRKSERSKIVTPALAQALEMTVAELEEATFGRGNWIDLLDDEGDPDHEDIEGIARLFMDDMAIDRVPDAIASCYLNGGLWGTLAAKVVVIEGTTPEFVPEPSEDPNAPQVMGVKFNPSVQVKVVPIPVTELIGDPDATCIDDMLGVAHEVGKPRAWLLQHAWGREYAARGNGSTGATADATLQLGDHESLLASQSNSVLVTEWHGKVPRRLLEAHLKGNAKPEGLEAAVIAQEEETDPLASAVVGNVVAADEAELDNDGDMVEAIVTILDKTDLALAIENPFLMKDRSIVACQFERVPSRFWGRGVMEKGYNPAKALDAEVRTRMDVMALISNPMMGADSTSLPRGFDMRVRPGKVWMTNGNPKDALFPVQFPGLDPSSFTQSGEMERMIQMGTGAMDTATPLNQNRRNETATGTSLIAGTFVKRSKRALRNITDNFVEPLVQKILWRRMEFDPGRYPKDFKFRIVGTLGIVAREIEQSQMTQMLGLVEQGSATQRLLVDSIFDASSSPYKAAMKAALKKDAEPDPEAQKLQQLQTKAAEVALQQAVAELGETLTKTKGQEADIFKTMAEVEVLLQEPGINIAKLRNEQARMEKEFEELREFSRQNDIAAFKAVNEATRGNTDHGTETNSSG